MPRTEVLLYCEEDGSVPLMDWFDELPGKAIAKCRVRVERLGELGHELRRPDADYLREGIYELRTSLGSVNYRMFYFFHGRKTAVLCHGYCKQRAGVPARQVRLAVQRKRKYEADPGTHTYGVS